MKTIAVTGINGYIASSVSQRLLEDGYKVIGLSIEDKPVIKHPNLIYIKVDLTNWLQVQSIIADTSIDILLHFAGIAHVIKGQNISDEMYKRINYLASKNLFRCAYAKNVRVFFASSIDVYGACKERVWTEDVISKPVSTYAKTKYMAECSLEDIYKDKQDKYLIGRFAPVYSSSDMKDPYKRIYIRYPKLAMSMTSNPSYTFLALDNIADFIVMWVNEKRVRSNLINICDEDEITSQEFVRLERESGRAKKVISIPRFLNTLASNTANRFLYSESKSGLGFALVKLFDPRIIDKTQIVNTGCCNKSIRETIYKNL